MCDRSALSADAERAAQSGVAISFRAPPALARQVEQAAARELLSVASYVRRAVASDLRAREGASA